MVCRLICKGPYARIDTVLPGGDIAGWGMGGLDSARAEWRGGGHLLFCRLSPRTQAGRGLTQAAREESEGFVGGRFDRMGS